MNVILPLLTAAISFVFAVVVFAQWLSRRKAHQFVWMIGLLAYAIGAGCELAVGVWGWSDLTYRLWYLFGAILVAAYLGMGTVYLIAPRKAAHIAMLVLILASLYAVFKVFTAPTNLDLVVATTRISGAAMPNDIRLLTPLFNIYGTVTLVGGAAYSAWVFWRKRILPRRMLSCVLIAIGGMLPAFGGTMLRFGIPELFFLMEFLGVSVIFVGFLSNHEIVALRSLAKPAAAR